MKNMQKIEKRNTYTAAIVDTPLVHTGCCDPANVLDRGVGQSSQDLKTFSSNSEVDQHQHTGGENMSVSHKVYAYVLNMRGQPLMPTTPRKARKLLKEGKAKLVRRSPFTIQLNYATGETKQPIILGNDPGYIKGGLSAVTEKHELMSCELRMRNDVSRKIGERKRYRRNRRGRLWNRKPNKHKKKDKKERWLSPSIEHKLQTYIIAIEKIRQILPVSNIILESSTFDTQKMQNPEITGIEYQQGELQGYEVREYLLEKWGRKCAYCGKENVPLEIDHIIPKSRGGSDRVSNLTISCHKCNQKKGNMTAEEFGHLEVQEQAKQSLKQAAFMNVVRRKLVNHLNCNYTYGYITKHNRSKIGLEKSHVNDAFVIAGGVEQERCRPFIVTQSRRNNRSIQTNRKGFKPSIRRQRYKLQPNDLVRFEGKECRVKGVFNYGKWVRIVDPVGNIVNTNIRNAELIKYGKGLCFGY